MFRHLVTLLCLICSVCLGSQAARADFVRLETNTALRSVWLFQDDDTKNIRVQPVFVAGEADFDGPEGLSHYLEHLMYWQAAKVNDQPYHGRSGNAWVNGFVTTYYNFANRSELDNLFTYAKRLLTPPELDEKFMLDERRVVQREYDFRVVENPDRRVNTANWRRLAGSNPAGRSVIGTPDSIGSLTLDHARLFHERYYHPSNLVLLITGPIDRDEATRRVNAAIGEFEPGAKNDQLWRDAPTGSVLDDSIIVRDRYAEAGSVKHQFIANWTTGDRMADIYTVFLTRALLRSALPGGLTKPLRTDEFVLANYSIYMSTVLNKRVEFLLEARPDDGVEPQKAIAAIRAALKNIGETGVSEKSFERIKKRLVKTATRQKDDAKFAVGRATMLLTYGVSPNSNADHIDRLNSVDKDAVDSLLKALGSPSRQISTMISPEASQ